MLDKNLFIHSQDGISTQMAGKLGFPQLPEIDGNSISYENGRSQEENANLAVQIERHLNQFRYIESSQVMQNSMENEDALPSLTKIDENGKLTLVKITSDGQVLEIQDQTLDWWSQFTFFTNRWI